MSDDYRKQLYKNFNQKTTDELIEIWQTNNRAEWAETTFDIIREIFQERLGELPSQNEPIITEAANHKNDKEKLEEQDEKPKFNWLLPLLGAIGFGIGFAVTGAIMLTIYNIVQNSFAHDFNEPVKVGINIGMLRGIIVGGFGGGGLGLALKDKIRARYFPLAGAIGFGIAFALVISIDHFQITKIGWTIIELMGGPAGFLSFETQLAHGLGIGLIIGAIGGSVLGLAAPKYRAISSLLLCFAGIISFGNVFAFGCTIFDGNFYSSFNALGGALGGGVLGAAFALYYMIADRIPQKQS
jgi:hypothetical protein